MFIETALIQLSSLLETAAILLHIVALKHRGGNHVFENLNRLFIYPLLHWMCR